MDIDLALELRHLRYFVAVAEELHFGRAALRLHIAQPPLSQQIRRLEELLGHPLFLRTSRFVALTPAGEAFLDRARRTLGNVQHDIEETRSIARGELGSLHVGFVGSAMLTALPGIFSTYHAGSPGVRLHLHESFTARVLEGLTDGALDVGILRDGDPADGLTILPIFTEPFIAVLPASHRCARQKSLSPALLRDDPFVFYPRTAGTRAYDKPLTLCENHGFRPHIVQEASHWLTILRLVGAGLGVSIAPACVRRLATPDVVCLPLRGSRVLSHIELAYHAGDTRPIVQRFAAIATQKAHRTTP